MKILDYWPEGLAIFLFAIVVSVQRGRKTARSVASWWVQHIPSTASRRLAAGLAAVAPLGLFAVSGAHYPVRAHVVLVALCITMLVLGLPWLATRTEREQAASDAKAAARVGDAVTTALEPLADVVLRCATADAATQAGFRNEAIFVALSAVATLVGGTDGVRATYYKVVGEGTSRQLEPQRSVGRAPEAQTVFKCQKKTGRAIFKDLDAGKPSWCSDVKKYPPKGWKYSSSQVWQAFMTVPIVTSPGKELLGMLVADSSKPNDFNEDREPQLLRLVAIQLAAILAICPQPQAPSVAPSV